MAFVTEIVNPLISLWASFVEIFPGLVAALIVLIVGYIIALLLGHAVRVVLVKAKIDAYLQKMKLPKEWGRVRASAIFGTLLKWFVFVLFIQAAVELLELGTLSELLQEFAMWLPHLIFAVLAVFLGLFIAHYVGELIRSHTEVKYHKTIAMGFKALIMFIAVVIALEQLGINISLIENSFLILIAGLSLGLALAVGISFGLGLKGDARSAVQGIRKKL
ncbi:MAG: hypothetical protein ABIF40_01525 [archaeon]